MARSAIVFTIFFGLVSAAWGAATPVAPAPDAVVSHPTFRWTLPQNETSEAIYIANDPQTTLEGRFVDRNVVASNLVTAGAREWTPARALYAGRYWWLVRSFGEETFETYFSPATPFAIPAEALIARVDLRRYSRKVGPDDLAITARWQTNVREAVVTARLFRKSRLLWTGRERGPSVIGSSRTTFFSWRKPPRIRQGTRLRLVVTLRAGTANRSVTRLVRAP